MYLRCFRKALCALAFSFRALIMFRCWYAQQGVVQLNEDASASFLADSVDVHKQTRVLSKNGVAKVVSSALSPMSRLAFMRLWVVWFAIAASAGAVAIYAPNALNPGDLAVRQAISYIKDTFPTVDAFNAAYLDMVFSR